MKHRKIICGTTAALIGYLWWKSIGGVFQSKFNIVFAKGYSHSVINETLSKNAAARHLKHPKISSIYVNSLASNKVMEDRHIVHLCPHTGTALFTVIDGHVGWWCAEHIRNNIASYVTDCLKREELSVTFSDIFECSEEHPQYSNTLKEPIISDEEIKEQLKKSFVDLDDNISKAALDAVKQVSMGHLLTDVMEQHILRAVTGACVNALLLCGKSMYVANTGDCRSVLGRKEKNKWVPVLLSIDHAYENKDEVTRIMDEHPGETRSVIMDKRLLGGLMPFRSFGDVNYKWKEEHLKTIYQQVLPYYYTPPYLTAEPEVSHQELNENDKFVVIATDGLWERLSSEQVVDIVGKQLEQQDGSNVATVLLKEALGNDDEKVYELLTLTPPYSRYYRDDITIIVITFK